jgi:hypothetical protein
MDMNRIKFLSAENGTWNIKTAANQHTEEELNPLAVSGINGSYPDSRQDSEVHAVSRGVSIRKCTVQFLEICSNTVHVYTRV